MHKADILKCVDENRLVKLLEELIRIPSPTGHETDVARFLQTYLTAHDLDTEMFEVEKGRFQPVARIKGSGGGYSLMFNGHMDAPVFGLGVKDPFVPRTEGGRLHGHGAIDMKGGVAAMVEAAIAVKTSGAALKGDLVITPVVGELQGGVGTVANIQRGILADCALVPEPKWEFFLLAHAGVMQIAITIIGRDAHVSKKEEGINAAEKMAVVIEALNHLKFNYKPDPRFPELPKMIVGSAMCGHGENYTLWGASHVPDYATIVVDVRFLPGMHPEQDMDALLKGLAAADPQFKYEMRATPNDPALPGMPWDNFRLTMPFQELSPDELIVRTHAANYKYLTGRDAQIGTFPVDHPRHRSLYAGDDDAHLTAAGIPAFTCGPAGGWDSTGLQYVEIASLARVARNFALTACDICSQPKP